MSSANAAQIRLTIDDLIALLKKSGKWEDRQEGNPRTGGIWYADIDGYPEFQVIVNIAASRQAFIHVDPNGYRDEVVFSVGIQDQDVYIPGKWERIIRIILDD